MMKYKYTIIGFFGLALWFGETWYFGWNYKAKSVPEMMLDNISTILMIWGIIGDILSNVKLEKSTTINTNNVEFKE